MAIVINPSDSAEYPITNSTSGSTTLSIGYIKSRIGTGNFILYWQGSNYAIARLTDTTGDVYLADALHVGFLDDDDRIFINGVNQKENFRYGYDPNTGGFTILYGTALNFSSRVYGGKVYIYYPVANASHSQVGVFTSYATLYINNEPVVQYVWSSVPAVSGKNGILSLPTLIDTDGEPISGQSASVFSSLPEGSNVRALINGAL